MSKHDVVVLVGEWLYDGSVPMPVYVVRYNFDYNFELAKSDAYEAFGGETMVDEDERAELNAKGFRFDLSFQERAGGEYWPDARGGLSVDEAKEAAQAMLHAPVTVPARQ